MVSFPFVPLGNLFFRFRNYLFPLVFIAIAVSSMPRRPFLGLRTDLMLDGIGLAVAVLGQVLRAAVIGLAYIRRGGKNKRIYADDLVQDGIFAHSRNPLYVGNLLVFIGLFLVVNSPLGYAVGIPFFVFAYWAIVHAEEAFLRVRFGPEYDAYCRRVPRFALNLHGLGATLRGMKFQWKRLVRKEYGSTFTWITTVLALLLWERYLWYGAGGARSILPIILGLFGLVLLGYSAARTLKKRGRLKDDLMEAPVSVDDSAGVQTSRHSM